MAESLRIAKVAEFYIKSGEHYRTASAKSRSTTRDVLEISSEALDKLRGMFSNQDTAQPAEESANKADTVLEESLNILNLSRTATRDEIRKAYIYAIKQYHPDKYSGLPPEFVKLAEEKSKQIGESYRNLMSIFA